MLIQTVLSATGAVILAGSVTHGLTTDVSTVPPYDRSAFGSGWADVDKDGCNTRAEVLMRDMTREIVRDEASGGCLVLAGNLRDPYSTDNAFVEASSVDVDHTVALADAWRSGAWSWSDAERRAFVNDRTNLVAAGASVNRSKGDRGPDEWLPPDYRDVCTYIDRYRTIKNKYDLRISADQDAAMAETGCE